MKISITTNNKVFSVEDELGFDCTSVHEAVEMFKGLLVCAGYHPCNVDDAFDTEHTWFTEQEIKDNLQGHTKEEVQEWQNNLFKQNEDDGDYVF